MPHEKLRPAYSFDAERLTELRRIAPEAFADGRVNFDTLREALGEHLEPDGPDDEHFGLSWPGKRAARRLAATPSAGALVPAPGEGLHPDGNPDTNGHNHSRNVFIEGENLEVLKLLQKAYAGRIKMIYIDPPYNTGKDFVYEDDFKEPLQEYLRRTGQLDEEGRKLSTNTRSDGRFHSNWLSMMYPRLRLARNLLKDEGLIFVSIDDNEFHHLRSLMNEVFGEENFRGTVIWQHSIQPKGYTGKFSIHHNYHVCYSKIPDLPLGVLERTEEHNKNYSNPDNDPNGAWRSGDVRNALYRKNLIYDIDTPSGKVISPPSNGWRWSKETVAKKIATGEIVFNNDETKIIRKIYLNNLEGRAPESIWFGKDVGTTRDGIAELKDLFNEKPPFDTPKPSMLIEKILEISTSSNDEDIILDFFAGSSSTAHAILNKNYSDEETVGNRKFILIQIPENVDESKPAGINAKSFGLNTISQVGMERIKRVVSDLNSGSVKIKADLGFRVFRLTPSHYKAWQHYEGTDLKELEDLFSQFESPLREGWTPEGLLTEVMLIEGFPLDSRQEALGGFSHNRVVRVTSDFCAHALLVCLDARVHPETIAALEPGPDDVFICLDSALTDEQKARLSDKGMLKTI